MKDIILIRPFSVVRRRKPFKAAKTKVGRSVLGYRNLW